VYNVMGKNVKPQVMSGTVKTSAVKELKGKTGGCGQKLHKTEGCSKNTNFGQLNEPKGIAKEVKQRTLKDEKVACRRILVFGGAMQDVAH